MPIPEKGNALMTHRENAMAMLHYETCERVSVVSFGYWEDTVEKWAREGHITWEEARDYIRHGDNGWGDRAIMDRLGFDFNWNSCGGSNVLLDPPFEVKTLEEKEDGSRIIRDSQGLICLVKEGITSIPAEIGTMLTCREAWEQEYLPRLKMHAGRACTQWAREVPPPERREIPVGLHLGSLMGHMRNLMGVEQLSYLYADDYALYGEIVDTLCGICYDCARLVLETGVKFDYAHFWEDICFKHGPLVSPRVFGELAGPWYRRITDLARSHGIDIISVDCDGMIDKLLPIWLENGVNTMFPIEVGTWGASIAPWRERYGRELRGVGGMDKRVFARDKAAVEAEVERLKPLIALGGYIPCPDHRIAPDADFNLVRYYCSLMHDLKI